MSVDQRREDELLDQSFEMMRQAGSPVRDAATLSERSQRLLPGLEATVARRRRFRRQIAVASGLVAAAAAVLLAFNVSFPVPPSERLRLVGSGQVEIRAALHEPWQPATSETMPMGSAVRTANDARADLKLAAGATLSMAGATELALDQEGKAFFLRRGLLKAGIPASLDQPLSVRSSRAAVSAQRGRFTVSVAEEGALPCVIVLEGQATLQTRQETVVLRQGERRGCSVPPPEAKVPTPEPTVRATESASPQTSARDPAPPPPPSDLAEQNRLFQRALSAERAGELHRAIKLLDQLIGRYPESPLGDQARVQKQAIAARVAE